MEKVKRWFRVALELECPYCGSELLPIHEGKRCTRCDYRFDTKL